MHDVDRYTAIEYSNFILDLTKYKRTTHYNCIFYYTVLLVLVVKVIYLSLILNFIRYTREITNSKYTVSSSSV